MQKHAKKVKNNGNGCLPVIMLVLVLGCLFSNPKLASSIMDAANTPQSPVDVQIDPKYLPEATPAYVPQRDFSFDTSDYVNVIPGERISGIHVIDVWDGDPTHMPVKLTWSLSVTNNSLSIVSLEDKSVSVSVDYAEGSDGAPGYNINIVSQDGYTYVASVIGNWIDKENGIKGFKALYAVNCRFRMR